MDFIRTLLVSAGAVVALAVPFGVASAEPTRPISRVIFHNNNSIHKFKVTVIEPKSLKTFTFTVNPRGGVGQTIQVCCGNPIEFYVDNLYWRTSYALTDYAPKVDVFMDQRNNDTETDVPSVSGARNNYRGKQRH